MKIEPSKSKDSAQDSAAAAAGAGAGAADAKEEEKPKASGVQERKQHDTNEELCRTLHDVLPPDLKPITSRESPPCPRPPAPRAVRCVPCRRCASPRPCSSAARGCQSPAYRTRPSDAADRPHDESARR
jgi:hypothetical protein